MRRKISLWCSVFLLPASPQLVVGYNFDWTVQKAALVANRAGVSKTALTFDSNYAPKTWVSKFNSLSFNQMGIDFPYAGINSAGVSISLVQFQDASYPDRKSPSVTGVQLVQLILDLARSLDEALNILNDLTIDPNLGRTHFFICDQRECGVVEFVNNQQFVFRADDHSMVLTNSSYPDSKAKLASVVGFGGDMPFEISSHPLSRFMVASYFSKQYCPKDDGHAFDYAIKVLDNIRQHGFIKGIVSTQWHMVYRHAKREIFLALPGILSGFSLSIDQVDFSFSEPARLCWVPSSSSVCRFKSPVKADVIEFHRISDYIPVDKRDKILLSTVCK
ncbi:MAG: hypothetical protein AB7F43_06665 [Bacteriovoracia bacterium]